MGFDGATEKECSDKIVVKGVVDIGYPALVPQIVPVLKPFESHTDDSAYENTCDNRQPAPAFSCTVGEPNGLPQCSHPQAALPVSTYSEGPWPNEKEGSSWSLAIDQHLGI